jgi:hypothetical protein
MSHALPGPDSRPPRAPKRRPAQSQPRKITCDSLCAWHCPSSLKLSFHVNGQGRNRTADTDYQFISVLARRPSMQFTPRGDAAGLGARENGPMRLGGAIRLTRHLTAVCGQYRRQIA